MTDLKLAIFEIQANRGYPNGTEWSILQKNNKNSFVGPKMTPPYPAVSFNWIRWNRTCKTGLQLAIFEIQATSSGKGTVECSSLNH